MRKQEQIEEMVKTVVDREKNYVIGETECKKCNLNKCDLHCNIHSEISYDCETLYNAGYRKSEEVRKETAKEIYSKMYDFAYRTKSYYTDALNDIIAKIDETFNDFRIELESMLREYGVEVEE